MENCSVRELKKGMPIEGLIGINELVISYISGSAQFAVFPKTDKTVVVKVRSGHIYSDSARETEIVSPLEVSSETTIYLGNGAEVGVTSKYNIRRLDVTNCEFPIEQLEFISITSNKLKFTKGKVDYIKYTSAATGSANLEFSAGVDYEGLSPEAKAKIIGFTVVTLNSEPEEGVSWFAGSNSVQYMNFYFRATSSITDILGNNPALRVLRAMAYNNIWNNTSIRNTSYTPLSGTYRFASVEDTDNFLINMAACQGTGYASPKEIRIYPWHSEASDAAVTSLTSRGFSIIRGN